METVEITKEGLKNYLLEKNKPSEDQNLEGNLGRIDKLFDTQNQFVNDFIISILEINDRYLGLGLDANNPNNVHLPDKFERSYCYELYSVIRSKMKSFNYNNLLLNSELSKGIDFRGEERKHPDFILHESYTNRNKQVYAVEVKHKGDLGDIKKDTIKLLNYCKELDYQNGIFLNFNKTYARENRNPGYYQEILNDTMNFTDIEGYEDFDFSIFRNYLNNLIFIDHNYSGRDKWYVTVYYQ